MDGRTNRQTEGPYFTGPFRLKSGVQIVLLAKTKLNKIEVLICEVSIDSHINHEEFVSVNNKVKV